MCDTEKRVSRNSRDVLLLFSPQSLFCSKTLSVCHFLFCFFLVFLNPFADNIFVVFRWFYLCCTFPFFFSVFSFNHFHAIPFSNPPCFHFWSFGSSILPVYMILFWGLVFPFFLLVFVWFSSDCFVSFLFIAGIVFICFLLSFCGVCCFGFRLWHRKRCFPCSSGGFFRAVVLYQFGSGCSASFDLGQWSAQKQGVKQRDAFLFSIMGRMRLPFANGTRGCAKFATENVSKGRSVAKKTL